MEKFQRFSLASCLCLFVFWMFWFFNFTCRTILAPIAPILEDEFGLSHTSTSGFFTAISTGNGVALFLMGIFSNLLGHKRSILFSFLFNAFFLLALSYTSKIFTFYFLFFALGFTLGTYLPSALSLLTKMYSKKLWGKVISIHDSAASASIFLAPLFAYFILKYTSWRGLFSLIAYTFLILVFLFYVATKSVEEIKVKGEHTKEIFFVVLKNRTLWIIAALLTVAAGANMGLYYILPLFLSKELHFDISFTQKILGISRVGAFVFVFFVGFLVDLFEIKGLLFSTLFVSGLLTFAIPYFSGKFFIYALFIQPVIISAMFPLSFVLSSRIISLEKRAFANGFIVSIASAFGIGVIPYILGFFGDHLSFAFGIKALGILTLATSFVVFKIKEG